VPADQVAALRRALPTYIKHAPQMNREQIERAIAWYERSSDFAAIRFPDR
jgi:hypothetical protein